MPRLYPVCSPPPRRTVSQWADEFGVLSDGTAEPGKWRTLGYQRAIMDAFSRPEVEEISFIKSARLGWTEIVKHVIGFYIDQDPCSILAVQPAIEDAEGWSKESIAPFFDACEPLSLKVSPAKAKDSKSTITKKHYPGGILHIIGANSPRGFRRISTRVVLFDEIDGYPVTAGAEGDQLKLGRMRSETFWNRKVAYGSTPTDEGFSRIEEQAQKSSLGYCLLTCPHCGGEHIRRFREPEKPIKVAGDVLPVSIIQWDDDYKRAAWICPDGCLIENKWNRQMINACRWVAPDWEWDQERGFTFFDSFDGHIGFSLWAGYSVSPNSTPVKLVKEFLDVKDHPEKLKTFVNTVLGETWKEPGETVDPESIEARAVEYPADVPEGALVLTAGIDVQADRLEFEVVGWDEGEQSWNVDYQILFGDPTQLEVWNDLADALKVTYRHECGADMSIAGMCIDTGFLPSNVYAFVERFGYRHLYPVKGMDGPTRPIIEDRMKRAMRLRKRSKRGHNPEIVGVDEAKTLLYTRLKIQKPGPGYCHFPKSRDTEFFEQLTGEKQRTRYVKGRPVREWVKTRPRNEAMDNRNYALAAVRLIDPDWDKWREYVKAPPVENKPKATPSRGRRVLSRGI